MVKRNGFVSNSSSSSFILGVGILPKDFSESDQEFIRLMANEVYDIKVLTESEIMDEIVGNGYSDLSIDGDRLIVIGGGNSDPSVSIIMDEDPETKYLIVNITNDEGDSGFYYDEIGWDFDYSVAENISYYNTNQQRLINILKDIVVSHWRIGAERNG